METNNTPISAMAFTASHASVRKSRKAAAEINAVEVTTEPVESNSEIFLNPFEELSNPEGYLYYSPF